MAEEGAAGSGERRNGNGRRSADDDLATAYRDAVRAYEHVPVAFRKSWRAWAVALVFAAAGVVAEKTVKISDLLPGSTWREQVDEERKLLVPQFYELQRDVKTLRGEVSNNRQLGEEQRKEIIVKLNRLEDRLEHWFEKAAAPAGSR